MTTLTVYCKNLFENPHNPRYHVISATNANFRDRLGHMAHSNTILNLIGYARMGPQFQLESRYENPANYPLLKARCKAFLSVIDSQMEYLSQSVRNALRFPNSSHVYSQIQNIGLASRKGKRPSMEDEERVVDNFCSTPGMVYIGLYDGHGGRDTVNQVVHFLHENINMALLKLRVLPEPILKEWDATLGDNAASGGIFVNLEPPAPVFNYGSGIYVPQPPEVCLSAAFQEAFRVGYLQMDAQLRRMNLMRSGTTSVSVVVRIHEESKRRFLHVANVGDSRAVLCRSGLACRLTVDHKASLRSERERIINSGGVVTANHRVNGVLAISRALGDHMLKENNVVSAVPHTETIELFSHDIIYDVIEKIITGSESMSDEIEEGKMFKKLPAIFHSNASLDEAMLSLYGRLSEPNQQPTTIASNTVGATSTLGDFFVLLACDGIWDVMSDQMAVCHVNFFLKKYASDLTSLKSAYAAYDAKLQEQTNSLSNSYRVMNGNDHMNGGVLTFLVDKDMIYRTNLLVGESKNYFLDERLEETPQSLLKRAFFEFNCNYLNFNMSHEEAEQLRDTLKALSPEDLNFLLTMTADSLVALAYQFGSSDNLTAIVTLL